MDMEKSDHVRQKQTEDYNKLMNEFNGLQDIYDKSAIELVKTKEMEAKLKEDFERSQFDLDMCRERFDKCQVS